MAMAADPVPVLNEREAAIRKQAQAHPGEGGLVKEQRGSGRSQQKPNRSVSMAAVKEILVSMSNEAVGEAAYNLMLAHGPSIGNTDVTDPPRFIKHFRTWALEGTAVSLEVYVKLKAIVNFDVIEEIEKRRAAKREAEKGKPKPTRSRTFDVQKAVQIKNRLDEYLTKEGKAMLGHKVIRVNQPTGKDTETVEYDRAERGCWALTDVALKIDKLVAALLLLLTSVATGLQYIGDPIKKSLRDGSWTPIYPVHGPMQYLVNTSIHHEVSNPLVAFDGVAFKVVYQGLPPGADYYGLGLNACYARGRIEACVRALRGKEGKGITLHFGKGSDMVGAAIAIASNYGVLEGACIKAEKAASDEPAADKKLSAWAAAFKAAKDEACADRNRRTAELYKW